MTEPTDALLPCPFCGAAPESSSCYFAFECETCGAHGPTADSAGDEAIALWNRRNPAPVGGEPVAWTLTAELEKRETTTRAHLWFSDPVNCMWTPIFTTPQPAAAPTPVDPFDALRWGANVAETLLSIGRAIGFGRAQQILGEQWEAAHGCAPRGRMGVTVKDEVTCQMCGGKPYPGCNTEFQGEAACRFTHPSPPEGMAGWKWVPKILSAEMVDAWASARLPGGIAQMTDDEANRAVAQANWDSMIAAAPTPPTQAADSVLEDAARYRHIRDVPHSEEVRSVLIHQQNAVMDKVIDKDRAALAAKKGGE